MVRFSALPVLLLLLLMANLGLSCFVLFALLHSPKIKRIPDPTVPGTYGISEFRLAKNAV